MVVAVGPDPASAALETTQFADHVPDLHLFLHPALDRVTCDDAAQHEVRRPQSGPFALGQLLDVLQEFNPLRQHLRARFGRIVKRPLEPGVAHIDCHQGHAPHYCGFRKTAGCGNG
jgi:hypothetical protein